MRVCRGPVQLRCSIIKNTGLKNQYPIHPNEESNMRIRQQVKKWVAGFALVSAAVTAASVVQAAPETYIIDTKGAHAFVQFKVKHLGYSWLYGRFNDFSGEFTYDAANPAANTVNVVLNMASLDSAHAERDKHIRSGDFFDVEKFKQATFNSTGYKKVSDAKGVLTGDLTLFGKTKSISLDVDHVGGGADPWGGYRQGFEGTAVINPADWGKDFSKKLGPALTEVELTLSVEGIRK
ncbi:MAG: polyisoprenoid-binding protein YceI [Flavobacteriales bacterium]|jgi:polyisoprenoid-binding protein YceI